MRSLREWYTHHDEQGLLTSALILTVVLSPAILSLFHVL